jgi:Ca2+-binding RTX toxin-like protein
MAPACTTDWICLAALSGTALALPCAPLCQKGPVMTTLTVSQSTDFSDLLLFHVTLVDFVNTREPATAVFAGSQFGGVIDRNLVVDGSAGRNEILINTDFTGLDASGWVFHNWQPGDRVTIQGSAFSERLTGSAVRDVISAGGGSDTVKGRSGSDLISGGDGMDWLNGGSGRDTVSYRESLGGVEVDLARDLAFGGDATGDEIANFENVTGGAGNDWLRGKAGENRLEGGFGADLLRGRGGADLYIYRDISDSAASTGRDRIEGFSTSSGDRIDLARIDAVAGSGNDAFAFIGSDSFTAAGQLRYVHQAGTTIVQADTDGNLVADLEIVLAGTLFLAGNDFIL